MRIDKAMNGRSHKVPKRPKTKGDYYTAYLRSTPREDQPGYQFHQLVCRMRRERQG